MKYQHISGREADKRRRLLRDMQSAKRHKDLQELHEFKEKMRAGAESASKINELRRIEGYLAHLRRMSATYLTPWRNRHTAAGLGP